MDIFSQPDMRPERLKIALISQLILSPAFSDADPAELVKRVDEVWQVIYCTADQGQAEGDIFSLLAGPLIVRGGLKDERGSSAFPVDLNDVRFKSTGNKRRVLI